MEKAGWKNWREGKSQRLTELVGGIALRPYVPHNMKKIREGEGTDNVTSEFSVYPFGTSCIELHFSHK